MKYYITKKKKTEENSNVFSQVYKCYPHLVCSYVEN